MNRRIKLVGTFAVFFILGLCALGSAQEQLTITTYYPSPYGVYNTLRLYPTARPAACQEGEMYYDGGATAAKGLYICNNAGVWQSLAGGFWAASPLNANNIYNTNTGKVSIGTNNPFPPQSPYISYQGNGILDVADRMMVRTGAGGSGGIWFGNSDGQALTFVGTYRELTGVNFDPVVGFWNGDWRLLADAQGNVNATGQLCIRGDCRSAWPSGGGIGTTCNWVNTIPNGPNGATFYGGRCGDGQAMAGIRFNDPNDNNASGTVCAWGDASCDGGNGWIQILCCS